MPKITSFALLLLLGAGGAKKPVPDVVVAPHPGATPGDPPPALSETGRRNVTLTGDVADPTFANRKLSEWWADVKTPEPGKHLDFGKVRVALKALECYGPHAVGAIPDLVRLPGGVEVDPALWQALGRRAAGPLAEAVSDPMTRYRAGTGLVALGALAEPAVPKLMELMDHADPAIRSEAVRLLAFVGPVAKAAVPKLTDRLNDPDPAARGGAAFALS